MGNRALSRGRSQASANYRLRLGTSTEDMRAAQSLRFLLMGYLSLGAKICGAPAIDREFKTIDFLTLMDLETLPSATVERYLS